MGILNLVKDLATIAIAPVQVAVNLTEVVTKPLAEMAEDIVEATEEFKDEQPPDQKEIQRPRTGAERKCRAAVGPD